jgi:type II secretory pathway pseudopilin PulG
MDLGTIIVIIVLGVIVLGIFSGSSARTAQQQQLLNAQWEMERLQRQQREEEYQRQRRQNGVAAFDPNYIHDYPVDVIAHNLGYADEWEMAEDMGLNYPEEIYDHYR